MNGRIRIPVMEGPRLQASTSGKAIPTLIGSLPLEALVPEPVAGPAFGTGCAGNLGTVRWEFTHDPVNADRVLRDDPVRYELDPSALTGPFPLASGARGRRV